MEAPKVKMTEEEFLYCFDEALASGDIYVTYQPKINHSTGRMIGAEALMRWSDRERGMQYPSDFIPVLEKNDLIYRADLGVVFTSDGDRAAFVDQNGRAIAHNRLITHRLWNLCERQHCSHQNRKKCNEFFHRCF